MVESSQMDAEMDVLELTICVDKQVRIVYVISWGYDRLR